MSDSSSTTEQHEYEMQLIRGTASLGSLFRRQTRLYSTRTAEGFLATLEGSGEEVLLWLLRFPLAQHSGEDRRFIARIEKMQPAFSASTFHSAGVDEKGSAFVALRVAAHDPIMKLVMPVNQRVITWSKIVDLVARLHQIGVSLGDISEDSFVWDPERGPQVIGVMGTFDSAGGATAMLPPPTTLPFLAPEQRGVFVAEPSFDVYALGVYGYRILTGMYPNAELGSVSQRGESSGRPPIEAKLLQDTIPDWVNMAIGIALQPDSNSRFETAEELALALSSEGLAIDHSRRTSVWASQTAELEKRIVRAARDSAVLDIDGVDQAVEPRAIEPTQFGRSWREYGVWAGAGLFGITIAFLLFWLFSFIGSGQVEPYSEAHRAYVPPELEQHLAVISDRGLTEAKRSVAVEELADVENPFTYPILASLIEGAFDPKIRDVALRALAENIRTSGLSTVARVFETTLPIDVLRSKTTQGADPFLAFVRSADPLQPLESRLAAVAKGYESEPHSALRVVAALAIDTEQREYLSQFRQLLLRDSETLCLTTTTCEPRERVASVVPMLGLSGLLLSHPATVALFDDKRLEQIWSQSPETQAYVLEYLYYQNRDSFLSVLQMGLSSESFSPLAEQLVEFLRIDGSELGEVLTISIVRALVGVVDETDLFRFSRWKSRYAPQALVLISGILAKSGRAQAVDVFDIAVSKSQRSGSEKPMLEFVRASEWNQRSKLIYPVAVLLYPDTFSLEEMTEAFDAFEPYSARNFFDTLVKTKKARTIKLALLRLGSQLPSVQIMALLKHQDPEVRMEAVRALAGRNDISVMRDILAAYESESNPEVRRLYQRLHWVTGGR